MIHRWEARLDGPVRFLIAVAAWYVILHNPFLKATKQPATMSTSRVFANASTVSHCAKLFPTSVAAIQELAISAKQRALASLHSVYEASHRTFDTVCVPTDVAAAELSIACSILSVVKNTNPAKELRDEATKQMIDLDSFSIDHFSSNKKLYEAVRDVESGVDRDESLKGVYADPEYRYWLAEEMSSYRRRGLDLPDEQFEQVVALQKDISALGQKFSTNVAEDKTQITVPLDDLRGVPENVIKGLTKTVDGLSYVLKMDYPTYFGVMKNCEVASTRKSMADAFENRAYPTNENVLQDVIFKRNRLAQLLGYASYSHYDLDSKMAKTPAAAQKFIDELVPGLQRKWIKELEVLKANLHPSVVLTAAGEIMYYDIAFCMNQVKQTQLNVSETTIQEYFPLGSTVKALFDIYEAFFDIKFEKFENGEEELWHKDVSTLAVIDKSTGELLGHIILDLFPREGKYSHACCHSVVPAVRTNECGTEFSPALSVVLANFPAATADTPALFMHDDVETFFHEFGHAIHGLMGRSKMATFAGTRVKRDFVELPSQMLEEWLWEPTILKKVTSHYRTNETLPTDLIEAKVASKNAFSGRDSLRQLTFATYSLAIFGEPFSTVACEAASQLDTNALFQAIQPRMIPGVKFSETAHFECAFAHLIGYAATYYGYMWSEVFAQDVFQYIKDRDGLLSAELGKRYRDHIIGVGGGKDPNEMLKSFLEREPNAVAFLSKLGV